MRLRGVVDDDNRTKQDAYRADQGQRMLAGLPTPEEVEDDMVAPLDGSTPESRMLLSTFTHQLYTTEHLQYL